MVIGSWEFQGWKAADENGGLTKDKLTIAKGENKFTGTWKFTESLASILDGKLSPQDIKVWKKDTIDWEKGVKIDETGLTKAQKTQIAKEFSIYDAKGVKTEVGKAKFEDATTPARNSDTAQNNPFKGTIKVKFSDGSELLVKNQNLYVSELMTSKDNENAPADAIEATFKLGEGVKAKKGTEYIEGAATAVVYETYKVKPNLDLDDYELTTGTTIFGSINAEVTDNTKYTGVVWEGQTANKPKDHVVTNDNKEFTAKAAKLFTVKHVFKGIDADKADRPEIAANDLPEELKAGTKSLIPADQTVVENGSYKPSNIIKNVTQTIKDDQGEVTAVYEWTFKEWNPKAIGNISEDNTENSIVTVTGIWERKQAQSEKPTVNEPVKPGAKEITGKGEPGSKIVIKDKDDKVVGETEVNNKGEWEVKVPEDKPLKNGDNFKVTQEEKGKTPSDPVDVTVGDNKPAPQPEQKPEPKPEPKPVPEVEIPGIKYKDHKVPTYPVYAVVEKKGAEKVTPEIFTHEQYIFGYPDDTIRPDGDMTRAEAIAVVARLQKLDLSDKTSNIYKDTKAGMWYNAAINAAFREGYLLEKEGENIRPNDKITRAELALLISHIDKKNDKVAPFEDVKGHKFEAAINQAYGNERIKGYPDGTFKPDNSITRAEVATMLNKLYDRYPDKNFIDANQNLVHNYKDMSYKGHWGYYELVEAYHTHKFARLANNMEEWKAIIK